MNQDIEATLKQDKSEGAMAPLGPIVQQLTPVIYRDVNTQPAKCKGKTDPLST